MRHLVPSFELEQSFVTLHLPPSHVPMPSEAVHRSPGLVADQGSSPNTLSPPQRHSLAINDASGMPKLGFVFSRSASVIPALMAGLTGAAAGLVQLADVVDAPNAALRTYSLAAVPACDEMNVGIATQHILAHLWIYHLGH